MPPVNLSGREKRLVFIAGGFAVFYLFYQFFLVPMWGEVDKLNDKARKSRAELRLIESKIKVLEAFKVETGKKYQVPGTSKEEKAIEVLRALSGATSKSKLNLISIRPIMDGRKTLKFELSCSGNYRSLYRFLKFLRELKMLVSIDLLTVTGEESANPNLKINTTITAHY
jgi:Tfp pilus assembly protein PilO